MPAEKTTRHLERLKEQREKLTARIQATESRIKSSAQKVETRKKILVGAFYLEKAEKENRVDDIGKIMDRFLTRDSDRVLFGLAPLGKKA